MSFFLIFLGHINFDELENRNQTDLCIRYRQIVKPRNNQSISWTPVLGACDPGTYEEDDRRDVIDRINFYRFQAGYKNRVEYDSSLEETAKKALLSIINNACTKPSGASYQAITVNDADNATRAVQNLLEQHPDFLFDSKLRYLNVYAYKKYYIFTYSPEINNVAENLPFIAFPGGPFVFDILLNSSIWYFIGNRNISEYNYRDIEIVGDSVSNTSITLFNTSSPHQFLIDYHNIKVNDKFTVVFGLLSNDSFEYNVTKIECPGDPLEPIYYPDYLGPNDQELEELQSMDWWWYLIIFAGVFTIVLSIGCVIRQCRQKDDEPRTNVNDNFEDWREAEIV